MDTLSQILQATRARSPLIADLRLGADVSVGIPLLDGLPLHYVVDGSCRLETGSESMELTAGDFVMLSRIPHYRFETGSGARSVDVMDFAEEDNFSLDDWRTGVDRLLARSFGEEPVRARILSAIVMPGDREGSPLTRDLPRIAQLRNVKSLLEPWLVAAIEFMSTEVREPEPGLSAIVERLIELVFIAVLRKWLLDSEHERGWMRGLTDPTISRVLNAVHADPGRRWALRDLAIVSGRSRSGLAIHFREVMGETPFAYITRWRMHLAAAAVARGGRSTADIGFSLGYQAPQAFARAFLAAFGETPAQYKRTLTREDGRSEYLTRASRVDAEHQGSSSSRATPPSHTPTFTPP